MLGIIIALIVTIFAGWVILRKYTPQLVLFFAGVVLMALSILLDTGTLLKEEASTGFVWFDIFEVIKNTFSSQLIDVGLIIMAIVGFAKYMDYVGASRAMVNIIAKPLLRINKPYLLLALSYLVGATVDMFVPSAAGLGLLMMVTLYPALRRLGVNALAASSVMATTACLDAGPASGMTNVAAKTAGMDVTVFFLNYQVKVMPFAVIAIMVLIYFSQKYLDKRQKDISELDLDVDSVKIDIGKDAPPIYALLPVIPLTLVLIFNPVVYEPIQLNIVSAVFLTVGLTIICEIIRLKNIRKAYDSFMIYLKGMGEGAGSIVTIMVAGTVFATGLKSIGAINTMIEAGKAAGFGVTGMTVVLCGIIALVSFLCGSGNAAFLSFAPLAPEVAAGLGFDPILLLVPMQLSAGIARSMSPVAGVVIACAGVANQNPMDLAKRNAIPMLGALVVSIIVSLVLF